MPAARTLFFRHPSHSGYQRVKDDTIPFRGRREDHRHPTQPMDLRRNMRSVVAVVSAGLFCVAACALSGCETGRGNKLHASFESVSDLTTTPHPHEEYASVVATQPPVPDSPTAAGPDGRQPLQDNQARVNPSAEKGTPTFPRAQPQDNFLHQ